MHFSYKVRSFNSFPLNDYYDEFLVSTMMAAIYDEMSECEGKFMRAFNLRTGPADFDILLSFGSTSTRSNTTVYVYGNIVVFELL